MKFPHLYRQRAEKRRQCDFYRRCLIVRFRPPCYHLGSMERNQKLVYVGNAFIRESFLGVGFDGDVMTRVAGFEKQIR